MNSPRGDVGRWLAVSLILTISGSARAQAHYYNLDGGRPMRVEDAEAAALYSVDVDLAPFGVERLTGGTMRYRVEPKIAYGILPFTEVELRIPYVRVTPPSATGAPSVSGVAGASVGALHSFNLETTYVPAIAVGGELALPIGSLAPARTSYLAKLLMTKTTGLGRIHFNAGAGTYAVKATASASDTNCVNDALASLRIQRTGESCSNIPIIVDTPCDVSPTPKGHRTPVVETMCMGSGRATIPTGDPSSTSITQSPTFGSRWFGGVGLDHAFPLSSSLLTADLFAEKFERLYPIVDWTAELGVRRELTPSLVVDVGVGRHFAGTVRSTMLVVGAMYEMATAPLIGR